MATDALTTAWLEALDNLSAEQAGPAGVSYLRDAKPLGDIDGTILVAVPNSFVKGWIEDRVMLPLIEALSTVLGRGVRIAVTVDPSHFPAPEEDEVVITPPIHDDTPTEPEEAHHSDEVQLPARPSSDFIVESKTANLNPKYIFDTFVIGPSNRFAHAAASAVAEGPGKTFNPLFIYGDSGLGKTHLLHAIGHYASSLYPNLSVRYVNSEEFTNDFINSIREDRVEEFQRRYRQVDILLIDDIQFIQGKEQTVEEFFHTFNSLYNASKQVVLTSDLPPQQLSGIEERLRSRFAAGLLVDIQPPDLETRIAILQKKAAGENLEVAPDVLEYIASRIVSNIRELEGSLLRVTAYAQLTNQPVDLSLAVLVLKNVISNPEDNEITVPLIMAQSASYFGVTVDQLCSTDRSHAIVEARQIAMYLCRELTPLSLPKIGSAFGGRDHTTVMHANKKITELMAAKAEIYNHVTELTNRIKQAARS